MSGLHTPLPGARAEALARTANHLTRSPKP